MVIFIYRQRKFIVRSGAF